MTTLHANAAYGPQTIDRGTDGRQLKPPTLPVGGGGLVSSARDLVRFARMPLNEGKPRGRAGDAVRDRPAGIVGSAPAWHRLPATGGFGAGAGVVVPGVRSDNGHPGTYSAVGASSTFFAVDLPGQGCALFLAQFMPGRRVPMPEALRFRAAFYRAIGEDLKRRRNA